MWRLAGLNAFGLMRLVYLDLAICLPVLGIAIPILLPGDLHHGTRHELAIQSAALISLSGMPRWVAADGLHVLNGRRLYVSRGLGHEREQAPQIRFFCPPEITLLTLRS